MTSTVEGDEPGVAGEPGKAADSEGYDVGRLLAFSDGVFAIAITLLVLSIPVPIVPSGAAQAANLATALAGLKIPLLGFGVSFVLVGGQWITHHQLLRVLTRVDSRILWLNLLILLGVCLVPFATALLIHYGDTATGAIAYAVVQLFIVLTFFAMRFYLVWRGDSPRASLLVGAITVAGFAISIPVALRNVPLAYGVWVGGFGIARILGTRLLPAAPRRWTRSQS